MTKRKTKKPKGNTVRLTVDLHPETHAALLDTKAGLEKSLAIIGGDTRFSVSQTLSMCIMEGIRSLNGKAIKFKELQDAKEG